jgi:hypothetical protein
LTTVAVRFTSATSYEFNTQTICATINPASVAPNGNQRQKPSRKRTRLMSNIITTNRNSTITAPTYTNTNVIAKNSASSNNQMPEELMKASTKNNTA